MYMYIFTLSTDVCSWLSTAIVEVFLKIPKVVFITDYIIYLLRL